MSEAVAVTSEIDRVEVFRQSALVTRRAVADVQPGSATLCLEGLPLTLRDDSLRVALQPSTARIVDVHIEWQLAPRERPLVTAAQKELDQLERKQTGLGVARERTLAMIRLLQTLSPSGSPEKDLPDDLAFKGRRLSTAWFELADYIRHRANDARKEVRLLERKLRNLADAMENARDALERANDTERANLATIHKAARVQVADAPATLDLNLSYLVPHAQWVPEYDLRVHERENTAELVLRALVAQQTGEDWQQVTLGFSTADLQRSADAPELDSWRIGKVQPPKASGWRPLPDTIGELFVDYDQHAGSLSTPDIPYFPSLPDTPRLSAVVPTANERRVSRRPKPRPPSSQQIAVERNVGTREEPMMAASAVEPMAEMSEEPLEDLDDMCFEEDSQAAELMDKEAFGSAPPAPAAAMSFRAAAPQMAKKQSKRRRSRNDAMEPAPEPTPEPEIELTASVDALSYANLRMQGPDDEARGGLRAANFNDSLAEQFGGSLPEDATDVLAAIVGSASGTLHVPLPEHAVEVEKSAGHFATRYDAEGRAQLPADGLLHAVPLLGRRAPVDRVYRCVPGVDTNVFELAEFANPLSVPLLSGPVRVYRGSEFVVTAPMETTAPEKTLTVNLGLEANIVVARNTHFEEKTGGLFGGGSVLWHQIEIEIHNKLSRKAHVEIFERIPTTRDEGVEIELTRSQPTAERYDQRERGTKIHGGYKLTVDLEPQSKQTCTLEYQISLPSKRVLVGGNRRD